MTRPGLAALILTLLVPQVQAQEEPAEPAPAQEPAQEPAASLDVCHEARARALAASREADACVTEADVAGTAERNEGREHLRSGEAALEAGQIGAATAHFRSAARAFTLAWRLTYCARCEVDPETNEDLRVLQARQDARGLEKQARAWRDAGTTSHDYFRHLREGRRLLRAGDDALVDGKYSEAVEQYRASKDAFERCYDVKLRGS